MRCLSENLDFKQKWSGRPTFELGDQRFIADRKKEQSKLNGLSKVRAKCQLRSFSVSTVNHED